jgi:multicomponent Na+:H+ antiporter subunit D
MGRGALPWAFTVLVSWGAFAIACALTAQVIDGTILTYHLGGWAPPLGIEYRVDALSAVVLLIVSGAASIVAPYSRATVLKEIEPHNHGLFYTLFLLCMTGLLGVVITGDAFNVFVFLEIASLSTYVLVALGAKNDRRALNAAYTYLVMGTIGATFFVIGIGLAYMVTGTLNMADLASRLPDIAENRTVAVAYAFIAVGMGLKAAIFPLHLWLPNAYTYAPSAISAFLAGTSTKVAIYVLLRFSYSIFGLEFAFQKLVSSIFLMPLAILAMFAASIVAIFQEDIKRMLAYSSVAQVGYMVLGLSLGTSAGVMATVLHLGNHALMKIALFLALGCVMYRLGATTISQFAGLGRTMPLTMAAFVLGGLSLIGVPLTVGFVSKWYLIQAALEQGYWQLAILVVMSSLLAVIYVWRVVEAAYLSDAPDNPKGDRAPFSMLIPLWVLIAVNVYFGVNAELTTTLAAQAATHLVGIAP